MDSIRLKINELLMFYSGCHGNLVTIAMRYMADAYCPNEPPYQIWLKTKELLPYYCGCHGNLLP